MPRHRFCTTHAYFDEFTPWPIRPGKRSLNTLSFRINILPSNVCCIHATSAPILPHVGVYLILYFGELYAFCMYGNIYFVYTYILCVLVYICTHIYVGTTVILYYIGRVCVDYHRRKRVVVGLFARNTWP